MRVLMAVLLVLVVCGVAQSQQRPTDAEMDGRYAMCMQFADIVRSNAIETVGKLNDALAKASAENARLRAEIEAMKK